MKNIQAPLIKQGWLRALICFICIDLILYAFTIFSVYIENQFSAGTEKGDESMVQFGLVYSLMALLIFVTILFLRKFIDRKSFASLGFAWKGYTNEARIGFFVAPALLGIGSLILVAAGYLSFISTDLNAGSLLFQAAIMIVVAFSEELLFRGYLLNNLMQSMNKWSALSITAALFSLFHGANPDVTLFAVINIFLAGILLGINYIFTKNLWFGIFFHFAWNFYEGPVLGYDVSGLKLSSVLQQTISGPDLWTGGPFGFEGSMLCPLLIIATIVIFAYAFTKRYTDA